MKTKRTLAMIISTLLLCAVAVSACACSEEFVDFLESLVTDAESITPVPDSTTPVSPDTTAPSTENRIPFGRAPEVGEYNLPAESFGDQYEKEASEVIDGAIEAAVAYVNAMKDERHSTTSFTFDPDANGYLSKLTPEERGLYERIVSAGKNFERISVSESEYSGDLKAAYFDIYEPMTYCEPGLASYMTLDVKTHLEANSDSLVSHYSLIFDRYFDPARDANSDLSTGKITMEEIVHGAKLLDRVVKRVVRFMPDGLTTYDKYYYLAVVLCEKVSYDDRPDNCFTAYGALVDGKAVCEGYTSAYYMLCREAGLWCAYRDGQPTGVGHTWNMVKLDSGIFNVDVTWCDGNGKPSSRRWYDYFVRSDEVFKDDGHNATAGVAGTGVYEPCPYET